ncbi:helix-turn-helix domain-containing protein [Streptomyces sp. NPDC051677]|uniref:helix-turn-helix domain-containing protein n=1 Tax=Streptomyces sp. NPDC051677 TaxID=3365669 RepID=UPI0037D027D9
MAELRELAGSRDVPAVVALRARIVLWSAEGRRRKDIAELAGVAPLTVDRCKSRYAEWGVAGLEDKRRGGPRTEVSPCSWTLVGYAARVCWCRCLVSTGVR